MNQFGLSVEAWIFLQVNLFQPLHHFKAKVWVFGSRARGDFKPYSDLDILIEGESLLPKGWLESAREILEESNLPIKVDLVLKEHLAESYLEEANREKIEV